ncbi:hypothetical protein RchiOBHm_Chr1g0355791 [Rosa chinensis]|uniref:Uncharacterized protein n=1 Tax=Rosa chinensis TaxID=74649 RepID=A0A2P6SHG5_ROSCH|nr:hypothetical protein RchiOBHm_Chr1g0355791 [Rosa chinensis]
MYQSTYFFFFDTELLGLQRPTLIHFFNNGDPQNSSPSLIEGKSVVPAMVKNTRATAFKRVFGCWLSSIEKMATQKWSLGSFATLNEIFCDVGSCDTMTMHHHAD